MLQKMEIFIENFAMNYWNGMCELECVCVCVLQSQISFLMFRIIRINS